VKKVEMSKKKWSVEFRLTDEVLLSIRHYDKTDIERIIKTGLDPGLKLSSLKVKELKK
jgi:hypothetical protein